MRSPARTTRSRVSAAPPCLNRQYTIVSVFNSAEVPNTPARSATICRCNRQIPIKSGITVAMPNGPGGMASMLDNAPAFIAISFEIRRARIPGFSSATSVVAGITPTNPARNMAILFDVGSSFFGLLFTLHQPMQYPVHVNCAGFLARDW
jgi:hypothetical protein